MPLTPFLPRTWRPLIEAWTRDEPAHARVGASLAKPPAACRIALVSSAGLVRRGDPPFDQEGERRNPWWGDPSFREIPDDAPAEEVECFHLHIDPRHSREDLEITLPRRRLAELVAAGEVGSAASRHYSFMGYLLDSTAFERDTAPEILRRMRRDGVDAAVISPG